MEITIFCRLIEEITTTITYFFWQYPCRISCFYRQISSSFLCHLWFPFLIFCFQACSDRISPHAAASLKAWDFYIELIQLPLELVSNNTHKAHLYATGFDWIYDQLIEFLLDNFFIPLEYPPTDKKFARKLEIECLENVAKSEVSLEEIRDSKFYAHARYLRELFQRYPNTRL